MSRSKDTRCVAMKALCIPSVMLVSVLILGATAGISPASAQSHPGRLGVGGAVGRTNGWAIKYYMRRDSTDTAADQNALDVLLTWNLGDFLIAGVHYLFERPIPNSPLRRFFGAGITSGTDGGTFFIGPSIDMGVYFVRGPFQVFLQLSPGLRIVPETRGDVGSSVGLRYFF